MNSLTDFDEVRYMVPLLCAHYHVWT